MVSYQALAIEVDAAVHFLPPPSVLAYVAILDGFSDLVLLTPVAAVSSSWIDLPLITFSIKIGVVRDSTVSLLPCLGSLQVSGTETGSFRLHST